MGREIAERERAAGFRVGWWASTGAAEGSVMGKHQVSACPSGGVCLSVFLDMGFHWLAGLCSCLPTLFPLSLQTLGIFLGQQLWSLCLLKPLQLLLLFDHEARLYLSRTNLQHYLDCLPPPLSSSLAPTHPIFSSPPDIPLLSLQVLLH